MSAPTNFQVTGCYTFWKIQCFHFFLQKSLCYLIWPCRKIGQGQPRVIIWTNYDGLESLMLHTKFCGNQSKSFGEDFWRVFYHMWAWLPSWSCDPDAANKISFPSYPRMLHIDLALICPAVSEKEMFKHCGQTDGRRTDAGPWLYYKLTYEPSAQVS